MKEQVTPKKLGIKAKEIQPSRHFRELLVHFLVDTLKADVDKGYEFSRTFSAEIDPELAPGLEELFEMSGLDVSAPGHWQILLVAIMNAIYRGPLGRPIDWDELRTAKFMDRLTDLKRSSPPRTGIEKLCRTLIDEYPKEYQVSAGRLRDRYYEIRDEIRERAASGGVTQQEKTWMHAFGYQL